MIKLTGQVGRDLRGGGQDCRAEMQPHGSLKSVVFRNMRNWGSTKEWLTRSPPERTKVREIRSQQTEKTKKALTDIPTSRLVLG